MNTNASRQAETHSESLGQAFRLMLERLTRSERATYVLRTVFEYEYSEIAEVLGKTREPCPANLLPCELAFAAEQTTV